MYEFFYIKDDCNVIWGYFFCYGNVLWSVLFCIFYGLVWFVEVFKKIIGNGEVFRLSIWFGEGLWFIGNSVFFWMWEYNVIDVVSGVFVVGDVIIVVSGVGVSVGEVVIYVVYFGLSYVYGEELMVVIEKLLDWFMKIM